MRILLCWLTFILFNSLLLAQGQQVYTIQGKVVDASGAPLPYAYLHLDSLNKSAIANEDGEYIFKDIRPGIYSISAQTMGFKLQIREVILGSASSAKVDFTLEEDVKQLEEVTIAITSEKSQIEKEAKAITVIEAKEDKQKTADLGEVLSRSEGVSVRRAGGLGSTMRFSLNGLADEQIRFFVDDIPLEFSPYSLGLANIPVNLIKRVEIYKGVLPIQFGADALGGGVNVISNTIGEGFSTDFSYQFGSFNTHRATLSTSYSKENAFIRANGFYDFSANNYKVDVQVSNEVGKLQDFTVKRFHDDYSAHGANVIAGIRNKKNIDELSITVFYNALFKEVQHNQVMSGAPYGHVYRKTNSIGTVAKANVTLSGKWKVQNDLGYSKNEREFTDTSAWVYNWHGERYRRKSNSDASETPENRKSRLFIWEDNYFLRSTTAYQATSALRFSISVAPTYNVRTGDESFSGTWDAATTQSHLLTWVNSLAVNYKKEKWENEAFVKHYFQQGESEEPLPANLGSKTISRKEQLWGAGNVLIYKATENLWFKPSYEYTIRLPRPDEIFGDGAFTSDNLGLKPENSHNFNFQIDYNHPGASADWSLQSNVFGRIVKDLILFIPNNDRSAVYDNIFSANSYGVELGGKVKLYENKLKLSVNTTLQHFYNNSDEGHFARFKSDRIPNRPFYFGNAAADYTFRDIFGKKNKLLLFWQLRYTHKYIRTWESLGSVASKAVIPSQTLQNAGVSYQQMIGSNAVNLGIELQNLTNQKSFDFFGVQRPGRAVFMKIITEF